MNVEELSERRCTLKDYNFVYSIIKESLVPYIKEYFKPSKIKFTKGFKRDFKEMMIISNGRKKVGFYHITPIKNTLDITKIFFVKEYRGKGLGSIYMKRFEKMGYKNITLQVWENNPATRFYKKIGYKIVKKENHKIHMEKKLK